MKSRIWNFIKNYFKLLGGVLVVLHLWIIDEVSEFTKIYVSTNLPFVRFLIVGVFFVCLFLDLLINTDPYKTNCDDR